MTRLIWANISSNRWRSVLIVLIMALGFGGVISILTVAAGMKEALLIDLGATQGLDLLILRHDIEAQSPGNSIRVNVFEDESIEYLRQLEGIKVVSRGSLIPGATLLSGVSSLPIRQLLAIEHMEEVLKLQSGNFPIESLEVVLGKALAHRLTPGNDLQLIYSTGDAFETANLKPTGQLKSQENIIRPANPPFSDEDAFVSYSFIARSGLELEPTFVYLVVESPRFIAAITAALDAYLSSKVRALAVANPGKVAVSNGMGVFPSRKWRRN